MMLKKFLEHLGLEQTTLSIDGIHCVNIDESTDVYFSETTQYIRFESIVTPIPSNDQDCRELLAALLKRSARMVRYRREGIYVDRLASRVVLQHIVVFNHATVNTLLDELHHFLRGLEAWRSLANKYSKLAANV
ncbi:MAG: CesT family type III secretion system chaperone [Granulosicoccus sp.]